MEERQMIQPFDDSKLMKESFCQVFKSHNPFEPAGRDDMPIKTILFMTDSYHLEQQQFYALANTLNDLAESEFFVTEIEGVANPFDTINSKRDSWLCVNSTFKEYTQIPTGIENAVYSKSGSWGILLSHELHGLLVCEDRFWSVFQKWYPLWEDDVRGFIEFWRTNEKENGVKHKWLRPLLSHLNPSVPQLV
jgi:hypothetical protein